VSVNGITASYVVAEPAPELRPEPTPTEEATTATPPPEPTPEATPITPAPEPQPPEPESATNWLVIGIVLAAGVLLIAFLIYRFIKRRD